MRAFRQEELSPLRSLISRCATASVAIRLSRALAPGIAAFSLLLTGTGTVGNAIANGETRTIDIYHTHTKESVSITYKRNGSFDAAALEKLNWVLRDWRRDEPTRMDPRLFDIVWEVRREVGSEEPLQIVSAYRAPETNAMLRHRSRAVAKHSQHMEGKAMDFYLPDVSMAKVREIALRLQRGGVGYYPTSYNPFVHLDAGSVRHWPRMTRDQLARVFPDGKTVHIPTDGKPMERYDEALAEIEATGGVVSSYADASDSGGIFSNRKGKSFFAALFGGEEDDEAEARRPSARNARAPARTQVASVTPTTQLSYAPQAYNGESDRSTPYFGNTTISPSRPSARIAPAPVRQAVQPEPDPEPVAQPTVVASRGDPAQPQFVWNQGVAGTARTPAAALAEAPPRFAMVPLPPARPADLLPPIFASVPVPTPRPVLLASADPGIVLPRAAPASQAPVETTAAIGPMSATSALVYAAVPLPMARPAGIGGARIAMQPPASSVTAAVAMTTQPHAEAPQGAASLDRFGITALFAHAATATVPAQGAQVRMAMASAKPTDKDLTPHTMKPVQAVAMRFDNRPAGDLQTDRFAGPAVKAVPVARFAPAQ